MALQALGIIVAQGDTLSLKRAITYFLNNIARQVGCQSCALELCKAASCYRVLWPAQHVHTAPAGAHASIRLEVPAAACALQTQEQETIGAIGEDIFAVALDQPFR